MLSFAENYGSLKSDSTDGSEAERIIIINKPQTHQFCSNKIRYENCTRMHAMVIQNVYTCSIHCAWKGPIKVILF